MPSLWPIDHQFIDAVTWKLGQNVVENQSPQISSVLLGRFNLVLRVR